MRRISIIAFMLLVFSACSPQESAIPTLTVMTHDSFSISAETVIKFETANHVKLAFIKSGDTGAALNRAILTKDSPQADVFYGVDNTFLSRALREDIFVPYQSKVLAEIPDEFKLDPSNRALPVDFGDVCINYDKEFFTKNNLPVPQTLSDLLNPIYGKQAGNGGMLVVENPAVSSPGLAFLLTTISVFGPDHYLEFWKALVENGVVVVNDWNTAYYTNFSASEGKGDQPMVVSYASSPAAEVVFASTPLLESPTASIIAPSTCFRQIEFVGILKGTRQLALAQKFVDFMLGVDFQQDMPLQMFVYPVNPAAKIPDEFVKFAQIAQEPAILNMDLIDLNREEWIQAWSEVVLK
jgi:thiamine transport system substrate-binding protein